MSVKPAASAATRRVDLRSLALVVLVGLAGNAVIGGSVQAQIVSAKARYDRGILIVRGRTEAPLQYVSLNRFFVKRSNRLGRFVFRQTRLPSACAVTLRSEGQRLQVPIRNCPLGQ